MSYIALDFDTQMKAATESSDKEKTYELPDGHDLVNRMNRSMKKMNRGMNNVIQHHAVFGRVGGQIYHTSSCKQAAVWYVAAQLNTRIKTAAPHR